MILHFTIHKALHSCVMRATSTDNMMEQIGIPKDYIKMLRTQLKRVLAILGFVAFLVTNNAIQICQLKESPTTKFKIIVVMYYPVLIMFIADISFTSILKKVLFTFTLYYIINKPRTNLIRYFCFLNEIFNDEYI